MLRTGHLLHPASTQASRPEPGASLPGTLASPQAGLAPAGYRELDVRLRHDHFLSSHGARTTGRTWIQAEQTKVNSLSTEAGTVQSTFTCCTSHDLDKIYHRGAVVTIHWIRQTTHRLAPAKPVRITLEAQLDGGFATITQAKAAHAHGSEEVHAAPVRVTDRTITAPVPPPPNTAQCQPGSVQPDHHGRLRQRFHRLGDHHDPRSRALTSILHADPDLIFVSG